MPNGNIWLGKHRLAHHIYPDNVQRMVKRLEIEDNNLLLLRHPYLSLDQERGHAKALGKNDNWVENKKLEAVASRMHRSVRLEDKFDNLLNSNSWDPGR